MTENSTAPDITITVAAVVSVGYDNTGAMIYIIIVLLWYSIGIILMLGMQMKARSEIIEEAARRRTKLLIRNMRDHTNTKEILEELADKHKRARLWEIYLGTNSDSTDKLSNAETVRIRNIEKQLETINRNRRLTSETIFSSEHEEIHFRNRLDARQNSHLSPVEEVSELRRGSSYDQQALERLKAFENDSKSHEQMSGIGHKSTLRKYFRRHPKKPLPVARPDSPTVDSTADNLLLFTNQIDTLTRYGTETEIHQLTPSNERQNPYITYFYKPTKRPSILASNIFKPPSEGSM